MEDNCILCGTDVSDLGEHICRACSSKYQDHSLYKKLAKYCLKRQAAQEQLEIYISKLEKLPWYRAAQMSYLEKIIQVYGELIREYTEIIDMLEVELRHLKYKKLGGNAEVEALKSEAEQTVFYE